MDPTLRDLEILHQLHRSKTPLTPSQIVRGSGYYFEFKKTNLRLLLSRLKQRDHIVSIKEPVITSYGMSTRWVYRITNQGIEVLEAVGG